MFDEVVGLDYSQSFVDACGLLKDEGKMAYYMATEGDLRETLEAKVDSALVCDDRHVFVVIELVPVCVECR